MEQTLEKINKSALKFLSPLPLEDMYKIIVEEARKLVGAAYGSVFLAEHGALQRVYASSHIFYSYTIKKSGYIYRAFRQRKPYVVHTEKVIKLYPHLKKFGIKSTIIIPLSYKEDSIGVLSVQTLADERFSKKELQILKLFGSMASLAIKKAQLYQETSKALEMRDVFISLASHELRTPLTSINGYIQLLYSRFSKSDSQEATWVRELYGESQRMTKLVKELLEVNRVKSGQLQYNLMDCRLDEIIQQAVQRFQFTHPDKAIRYVNAIEKGNDGIIGDADKLLQVVSSLLSNAVKFSPPKSSILVSLTYKKPYLVLHVTDQGIGIAEKELPRIFQGFYKPQDIHQQGMGVGLLLARHILQSHHGTISVTSKLKEGTTFEVKIPRAKN